MSRNANRWGALFGFTIAAIAVAIAWQARTASQKTNAERAELEARRAAAEAELKRFETSRAATEEERAAALAELEAWKKKAAMASKSDPAAKPSSSTPKYPNPADLLAQDPKLQALSIAARRARFESTYGPFARMQRLAPEQVSRLGDAQGRFDAMQQDLMITAWEQKLSPKDPAIATLQRQAAEELRAAQIETLGEDGYAQLANYERALPARAIVQRFAGAMSIADQPLTAEQANQMTQLMADASAGSGGGGRLNTSAIDWTLVDQRAASILSERQLTLFKRIEPAGGGESRWLAQLDRAMDNAQKTMSAEGRGQSKR